MEENEKDKSLVNLAITFNGMFVNYFSKEEGVFVGGDFVRVIVLTLSALCKDYEMSEKEAFRHVINTLQIYVDRAYGKEESTNQEQV